MTLSHVSSSMYDTKCHTQIKQLCNKKKVIHASICYTSNELLRLCAPVTYLTTITDTYIAIKCYSVHNTYVRRQRVRGQVKKVYRAPKARADHLKILTPSGKDWLSCNVTVAWYERVNLCNRKIMIIRSNTKTYATYPGSRPPSGRRTPGPGMCTGFPRFVGTDNTCLFVQAYSRERPGRKHQSCSLDGRNEGWDVHPDISH